MITTNGWGSGAISVSGWGFPSEILPPWFEKIELEMHIYRFTSLEAEG